MTEILVLSGLHGLVPLYKVLVPYEHHASDMSEATKTKVGTVLRSFRAADYTIYSWCGEVYNTIIGAPLTKMITGDLYTRFSGLDKQPSAKGNVFPIGALLKWAYDNDGAPLDQLQAFIASRWDHPTTRDLQYKRLLKSGFVKAVDGRLHYQYHPGKEQSHDQE